MGATFVETEDLREGILSADDMGRSRMEAAFIIPSLVDLTQDWDFSGDLALGGLTVATTSYVDSAIAAASPDVDDVTIELNGDELRVKDHGITPIKADLTQAWAFTGAASFVSLSMGSNKITSLGLCTLSTDAASKLYVDTAINDAITGLDVKPSVRLATTAALPACTASGSGVGKTLTGNANGALTVDGVAVAVGNRILVKDQVAGADNGLYVVTQAGDGSNPFILTRTTDADGNAEVTANLYVFVSAGTVNSDTGWVLSTNDTITVDTTALTFTQFSAAGVIQAGAGLTKTGTTLDVVAADTSILVGTDDIAVQLNTSGGLETSTGVRVKLDGASLSRSASGLKFSGDVAGATLTNTSSSSISVDKAVALAPSGTLNAGTPALAIASTVPISGTQVGVDFATAITASSSSARSIGVQNVLSGASYTGAGLQLGEYISVTAPGTGTGYFVGFGTVTGNIAAKFDAFPVTSGTNVALAAAAGLSTGLNVSVFAKTISATTGKNVGTLSAARNTSGIAIGAYVGMDSADPSANFTASCALLVTNSAESAAVAIFRNNATDRVRIESDGRIGVTLGTLASGNNAILVTSTLPSTGSNNAALKLTTTLTSAAASANYSILNVMSGAYTGAQSIVVCRNECGVAGTGTNYFPNSAANYGCINVSFASTAGANVGASNVASGGGTGLNIACLNNGKSANSAGKNVGTLSCATVSATGYGVGVYAGLDTSAPDGNFTSTALLVSNASEAVPIAIFRDSTTDKVRIEDGGRVAISLGQLGSGQSGLALTATLSDGSGTQGNQLTTTLVTDAATGTSLVGTASVLSPVAAFAGAVNTVAAAGVNTLAGTGTSFFDLAANFGLIGEAVGATAGHNIGVLGYPAQSSTMNIGVYGRSFGPSPGSKAVGLVSTVLPGNSAIIVGIYAGLDSSNPTANIDTSTGLLVTNSDQTVPIAIFRDNTTDKVRIEDGGQLTLATGVSATPSLAHIGDLNTGLNFPAADTLDLVAGGAKGLSLVPGSGASTSVNDLKYYSDDSTIGLQFFNRYGTTFIDSKDQYLIIKSVWYGAVSIGVDDLGVGATVGIEVRLDRVKLLQPVHHISGGNVVRQQLATTVATTNTATFTTALTIPVPTNAVVKVVAYLSAIGSAGTNQHDVADLELRFTAKNLSGTVTIINSAQDTVSNEATWASQAAISGTNVLVQVQGDAASTVKWSVTADVITATEAQ